VIDHIREVKNLTSEEYALKEKIRKISEQRRKGMCGLYQAA
jgi:hypothetical protein